MGTSTSSAGAGSGSPFDPPWLDSAGESIDDSHADSMLPPQGDEPEGGSEDNQSPGNTDGDASQSNAGDQESGSNTAPSGRYKEARTSMGRFMRTGDRSDAARAIGSFVRKGLGGASKAASRMRTSSQVAAALGGFLTQVRDATDPTINEWVTSARARGLSAQDAALEVINQIVPSGGSVDEESAKHAMNQAIIHLYEVDPSTDIFALTNEQISSLMGYTLAFDVYNRVQLELGRVFEKLKFSAQVVQERLAQVQDYVLVVVRDAMQKVQNSGQPRSVRDISNSTLRKALEIFGAQ
ncbi:Qat anti-phage system associated protein QatB [Undibacterium curvum]|uniref:Qat anti-phage system associated protein QatB n=1 Tax=Undibacterium curvum TaxID=2762294 RepID=UPI003D105530